MGFVKPILWLLVAFMVQQLVSTKEELLLPFSIAGRPLYGFNGQHLLTPDASDKDYEKYITQKIDQLNSSNNIGNFQQRYFVNTQWKGNTNGAVHILYLEGEGPASASKVKDASLPHVALAKDLKATVWCLEHRFYGKSQPFKVVTVKNLAYLKSQQMIEDIANFIDTQNKNSKESKPKWVVVGASYGGSLALWFRKKYPTKTVGAVSDSAAIQPTIDFWSYEKSVEEAYANYSYECWHGIKFSAQAVRNEIQYEEGVERMNLQLNLQPKIDEYRVDYKDYQHLHHNILTLFELPVVYNKVNAGPPYNSSSIEDVCKIMTNETAGSKGDAERVFQLAQLVYSNSQEKFIGINNDYKGIVKYLRHIHYNESNLMQVSARSWFWQQCTEFGQFITTDSSRGLFASTVPNDYFIALCSDVFHKEVTVESLIQGMNNTVRSYGGSHHYYRGTNTVIFQGELDPWKNLGVNSTKYSSSVVHIVKGVGHAAVLQPPNTNKPHYPLTYARNTIMNTQVKKWVKKGNTNQRAKREADLEEEPKPNSHHEFAKVKSLLGKIEYAEHPTTHPFDDFKAFVTKSERDIERTVNAFGRNSYGNKMGRQFDLSKNNSAHIHKKYLKTGYIVQDVDHFNFFSFRKWSQRFFSNDQFQRDKNATRFLMIGGATYIDWTYVDGNIFEYSQWAKDFRAVMHALEHRFFGYSQPTSGMSVSNLEYLTTEQAVVDIAVFVNTMNVVDNQTNPRWIVFGGFYGGNLAAIFRLKYPELSLGAIASSAPMQARVDFYEYTRKVESDIKMFGKEGCYSAIRRYFAWFRRKMNSRSGRIQIKALFCIANDWHENYVDEKDAAYFLYSRYGSLKRAVEVDSENHWYLNYLCSDYKEFDDKIAAEKVTRTRKISAMPSRLFDTMNHIPSDTSLAEYIKKEGNHPREADDDEETSDSTEKKKKKDTGDKEDEDYEDDDDDSKSDRSSDSASGSAPVQCYCPSGCRYYSYNADLEYLQDIFAHYSGRQWRWMRCTQWGFLESTNYGYNMFESIVPINYMLDQCADTFGDRFDRAAVEGGVRHQNYLYGGSENYNGTNVVFVHNMEDPWSTMGVYRPLNPDTVTVLAINGSSHMRDMYREHKNDVKDLKKARKKIKKIMIKWVKGKK